ncbi:MAG: ABC transporter ATP-binding protein [Spirochaetaceae bacterium]|nr:ABC transporter ATP-binding protein [Spirochaetaceae bacterium]
MSLNLHNISVNFGNLSVLKDVSMKFETGAISVVLGPSGCGKTTILNLLTSMVKAQTGKLEGVGGHNFSYLFQEPRLLPWLTVKSNLKFVLGEIESKEKREQLCSRFLEMTDLSDFSDWYPGKLSGGMKQRVAIARAFAHPSDIILMDEPFQALDLKLKLSLINQFISLWKGEKRTVVLVTHDIHEAITLADKIFVLSEKPASIVDSFNIEEPRERRIPGSSEYLKIESRLFRDLIE